MTVVLPRRLPLHKASHAVARACDENDKARRMRNPLRDRTVRAFPWTPCFNSRGGTRTRDPGIMSAVL
jgi:hypothetical protein